MKVRYLYYNLFDVVTYNVLKEIKLRGIIALCKSDTMFVY